MGGVGLGNMSKGGEGRQNFGDPDYRWDKEVGEQIGVSKNTYRNGTNGLLYCLDSDSTGFSPHPVATPLKIRRAL